jgi:hypothetical protein
MVKALRGPSIILRLVVAQRSSAASDGVLDALGRWLKTHAIFIG